MDLHEELAGLPLCRAGVRVRQGRGKTQGKRGRAASAYPGIEVREATVQWETIERSVKVKVVSFCLPVQRSRQQHEDG